MPNAIRNWSTSRLVAASDMASPAHQHEQIALAVQQWGDLARSAGYTVDHTASPTQSILPMWSDSAGVVGIVDTGAPADFYKITITGPLA